MRKIWCIIFLCMINLGCVNTSQVEARFIVGMREMSVGVFWKDDEKLLSDLLDAGLMVNNLYSLQGNFNPRAKSVEGGAVPSDCLGHSLLYLAAASNATNCMKKLIEYGADPNLKSTSGATALFACSRIKGVCSVAWAEWFLINSSVAVTDEDVYGRTALQCAIAENNIDLVRFLIEHGANPNHSYDRYRSGFRDHWTLFDAVNASVEVANYFLMLPDVNWHVLDRKGLSVLYYINPTHPDYKWRIEKVVSRGIDINYDEGDYSEVKKLLRWASLCPLTPSRISELRELGLKDEVIKRGAVYAKKNGQEECCVMLQAILESKNVKQH